MWDEYVWWRKMSIRRSYGSNTKCAAQFQSCHFKVGRIWIVSRKVWLLLFCQLKYWNNLKKYFVKKRLYELGNYSDIAFEINGRLFKAHKCVLAARSPYFKKKFDGKWKNRSYVLGAHEEVLYFFCDRFLIKVYFN